MIWPSLLVYILVLYGDTGIFTLELHIYYGARSNAMETLIELVAHRPYEFGLVDAVEIHY